eukprot:TRINITY_DN4739_c0_g1_i1.p1 TRINITY_DN4739_c0_g1~~TRINITY_DN4739_c0_g1_i1.p1  ORF type:complete len:378 (+),score=47.69 TRINITY_DN4739_c0_g1_i1:87-1136(+)
MAHSAPILAPYHHHHHHNQHHNHHLFDIKPQNPIVLPPSHSHHQPSFPFHPPHLTDSATISPAGTVAVTIHQHHPPYDLYHNNNNNNHHRDAQNIQTLFIAGIPDDVKPREIHNLFRCRTGFDSCQLEYTGRGNQVVAFATFFNHQSAMAAMNALNGEIFDPQTGATLHIELARTNSRKRPRGNGAYAIIDKRSKASDDLQDTWSNDGDDGSDEPSGTDNPNSSNKGALAAVQSDEITGDPANAQATLNEHSEMPVVEEIPPCSTLFIANLGPSCTGEELKQLLSQYSGFNVLKMQARGGMPVAFADFEDVENATEAMMSLQGRLLSSSDRGGLHMEYARSKMRKPKEA